MSGLGLDVAAGVNHTLSQVSSALTWLVSSLALLLLDEHGQLSHQSLFQVKESAVGRWGDAVWWLGFTPLQSQVFRAFLIILAVNFSLITVFWFVYAQRISHTLSHTDSLRIVEDILKRNTNFKLSKDSPARP